METDRDKIAARIKEARTMSGLSQAAAADKLGLLRPTLSEIESGRRKVSAEELVKFAEIYKVDTDWLLFQNADQENIQMKLAARELSKLSEGERQKLFEILKILPK